MEKITKQAAEKAVADFLAAKRQKQEAEGRMGVAEGIVEAYCSSHLTDFADGKMPLGGAVVAIKSGAAKPVRDGKALSTAARTALALVLPERYIKMSLDCAALYAAEDKVVRRILKAQGVEIVRDDKFAII